MAVLRTAVFLLGEDTGECIVAGAIFSSVGSLGAKDMVFVTSFDVGRPLVLLAADAILASPVLLLLFALFREGDREGDDPLEGGDMPPSAKGFISIR